MSATAHPEAGLDPARPARRIRPGERIHVIGAAGAGASAAALHGAWAGAVVDGCDPGGRSPYTPALDAAGIAIAPAHDPAHVRRVPPPDRLAVTKALTAIAPDHPELVAAREAGIPIEPWQQVIADAAVGRQLIGIAGTHGKSTTAGWLSHVLAVAGLDPAAFVGALLPASLTGGLPATARCGSGPFVVEADEYAGNFDAYRPDLIAITNIDWDHPDVFADIDDVGRAFEGWLRRAAGDGRAPTLVMGSGFDTATASHDFVDRVRVWWPGRIVMTQVIGPARRPADPHAEGAAERLASGTGRGTAVLARVEDVTESTTVVRFHGHGLEAGGELTALPTAGLHNVSNAAVAAAVALELEVAPDVVMKALASYEGVGRRLERKGEIGGVVVFDDYGHHPTAIRATLEAVRQRAPGRPVWAVYEPLTFHRTAALLDDFADVLATADAVAIADIWAGRDPDLTITSAVVLAEAVAARNPAIPVAAPGSVEATAAWLAGEVRSGDAVLVMGGGRSYRIGELLLEALADR